MYLLLTSELSESRMFEKNLGCEIICYMPEGLAALDSMRTSSTPYSTLSPVGSMTSLAVLGMDYPT